MKVSSFENAAIMQSKQEKSIQERKTELANVETKNGLPVIGSAEYDRLYNTDVRELGENVSATFDFQGYVRYVDGGEKEEVYRDVFATNGLLKEIGGRGIHIGTDGIAGYSIPQGAQGPEGVGEYDIYITVPSKIQKAKNVFCTGDNCWSMDHPDWSEEDKESAQENKGWIVMRLILDPRQDSDAREKARVIHASIVRHIEEGGRLEEVRSLADEIQDRLMGREGSDSKKELLKLESGDKK